MSDDLPPCRRCGLLLQPGRELCAICSYQQRRERLGKGPKREKRQKAAPRFLAANKVALRWGDRVPRCRFDTLPEGHPLKSVPCYGQLQIDHMNVDGKNDRRNFYRRIFSGSRSTEDLRILCVLHQLWSRSP